MTIKEVSKKYNISQDTLRYYERAGIIPPVTRTSGGIRDYSDEDISWVLNAKCLRSAGVSVESIVEYLRLYKSDDNTFQERLDLLTGEKKKLLARKAELEETLSLLDYKIGIYADAVKTGELKWPKKC